LESFCIEIYINSNKGNQTEWQMVFVICAVIYAIGGLFYCVLCDGNLQDWAKSPVKATEDDDDDVITTNM
jgi:hypothetical protein